ncbi:hypothetical protein ACIBCM_09455 [Streptomyces sp. NPDC051018]
MSRWPVTAEVGTGKGLPIGADGDTGLGGSARPGRAADAKRRAD